MILVWVERQMGNCRIFYYTPQMFVQQVEKNVCLLHIYAK